jgi:hypothetical protein
VAIKRQILAKQQQDKSVSLAFWRISFVAMVTSTLLLIGLLVRHQADLSSPALNYQTVQFHSLDSDTQSQAEIINNRYAAHYNKQAVLRLQYDGWQLKTCDQEVIRLSQELVLALDAMQQLDVQLNSGDIVDIAFDQTGIILGIQHSIKALFC